MTETQSEAGAADRSIGCVPGLREVTIFNWIFVKITRARNTRLVCTYASLIYFIL